MKKRKILFIFTLLSSILCSCANSNENINFTGYKEFIDFEEKDILPLYKSSLDGVMTFYEMDEFERVDYDVLTNTIIIQNNSALRLYDYETKELKTTIGIGGTYNYFDVYNGKIAYRTVPDNNKIACYDIENKETVEFETPKEVDNVIMGKDFIISWHSLHHDFLYKTDIFTNQTIELTDLGMLSRSIIEYNGEANVLFILESHTTDAKLIYYNVNDNTSKLLSVLQDNYNFITEIYFDGTNMHIGYAVRDGATGEALPKKYINVVEDVENPYHDFDFTLRCNSEVSLIRGFNNKLFVYSKDLGYIIYGMKINPVKIFEKSKTEYIVWCEDNKHIAILDLAKIEKNK